MQHFTSGREQGNLQATILDKRTYSQVAWLAVTEVWSTNFGLVTECCH